MMISRMEICGHQAEGELSDYGSMGFNGHIRVLFISHGVNS